MVGSICDTPIYTYIRKKEMERKSPSYCHRERNNSRKTGIKISIFGFINILVKQ